MYLFLVADGFIADSKNVLKKNESLVLSVCLSGIQDRFKDPEGPEAPATAGHKVLDVPVAKLLQKH